jgi:membrane-associated protease RseP (regulator of RpoE activity)
LRKYVILLVLPFLLLSPALAGEEEAGDGPKRGWLGVYPEDLSDAMLVALNLDHGVLIADVVDSSPAAVAGFQKGDVVVEFDGVKTGDADDLRRAIRERPGKNVKALVRRRGKETRLGITLGERELTEFVVEGDRALFELPRDALRYATRALKKAGPEVERVKVKVLKEGELHEELEELRAELEGGAPPPRFCINGR